MGNIMYQMVNKVSSEGKHSVFCEYTKVKLSFDMINVVRKRMAC